MERIEKKQEVFMEKPEVKYEFSSGFFWYSLLQKISNNEWGALSKESEFEGKIDLYFEKNELDQDLIDEWLELVNNIGNDEILFWFSLAVDKPELEKSVFEQIKKHKNLENTEEIFNEFRDIVGEFRNNNKDLESEFNLFFKKDIKKRQESQEEEKIIQECVDYFKPLKETSDLDEVVFLSTNPLIRENIGSGLEIDNGGIIVSNINNSSSKRHEFLHFIINPITEKLNLSKKEKEKIINTASKNLIVDQGYSEHVNSLINETLIKVYCKLVEGGEKINFDNFEKQIQNLTVEQFELVVEKNRNSFVDLNINSLDDLKNKSREFFDKYVRGELAERIFDMYDAFEGYGGSFENYFLSNYKGILFKN